MVPTASLVGSCDASSKITRSNFGKDGSIYWATDMGLISIQGHIFLRRFGILSNKLLIDIILPPLLMAFFNIPISEDEAPAAVPAGTFADSFETSSLIVRILNFSVRSLY